MNRHDYWNIKEAKRIELKKSLLGFTIFCIIFIFLLYLMRSHIYIISLIAIGGIIWDVYGIYKKQLKIISYPVMRIQNELLIYDYDQKVLSWDHIYKITWTPSKNRVTIFYKIPSQPRYHFLTPAYERYNYIDVKWIEEKENLIHDVQITCKEKEIPFIINPNENTLKQKDLIQKNQ